MSIYTVEEVLAALPHFQWVSRFADKVDMAEVRYFVENVTFDFRNAYRGYPVEARVLDVDGHQIQITIHPTDKKKNHLYCLSCHGICAAALATFVVKVTEPIFKPICAKCGRELADG